jgi:tetratricopeptide (TPR) repeat protein
MRKAKEKPSGNGADLEQAEALFKELAPLSPEVREARLASEPRFWSLPLARRLLAAASQAKDPRHAKALASQAESIGLLTADRYPQAERGELLAEIYCVKAQAHSELGDSPAAFVALDFAARHLDDVPLTAPARARLCYSAAVVHGNRGHVDAALALFDRATKLWRRARQFGSMGEAYGLRGWLYIDHGAPELALASFRAAVRLLEATQGPAAACQARCGVAMAYARLERTAEAEHALSQALERLPPGAETPSLGRLQAVVLERLGRTAEAAAKLGRVWQAVIEGDARENAVLVGVDLARLQVKRGEMQEAEQTLRTTATLAEQAELSPAARAGLAFVVRFALRREPPDQGLLGQMVFCLEIIRRCPDLGIDSGQPVHAAREWEEMDLATRRRLCEESGLAARLADLPGTELDAYTRELLRLTSEEVAQLRLTFEGAAEEPS